MLLVAVMSKSLGISVTAVLPSLRNRSETRPAQNSIKLDLLRQFDSRMTSEVVNKKPTKTRT